MVFYAGGHILMFRIFFTAVIILSQCAFPYTVHAVMISSTRIAYINIERVYDEIEEVRNARADLQSIVEKKKKQISESERAIASVRNKILKSDTELPPSEIQEFENMLSLKEGELKKIMEESKELIIQKEKEFKYRIMGKIYDAVEGIASKNSYTVIIDKESVLFAQDSVTDITDEVIDSLNKTYE